jgi:hypothetical protein
VPTATDPFAGLVDSPTAATPAVIPAGSPADPPSSPPLTQDPGPAPVEDPDWSTDRLSHLAGVLHALACACLWGGDVEGHGVDFEQLAAAVTEGVLAEHGSAGKAPVEAKVWAGAWGTLAATTALGLVTLLLDRLDVIPTLFGGQYPWVGGVVLVLGVVLPPLASFLRGYLAEHSPRPGTGAVGHTGGVL